MPAVATESQGHARDSPAERPGVAAGRPLRLSSARAFAFVGTLSLVLLYALRGGAYDLVTFEAYGLLVWLGVAGALALGLLPRVWPSRPIRLLLGALLAYAIWTAASAGWTESAERTMVEVARVLDYLGVVTLLALTIGRRERAAAAGGVFAAAVIVCILAVASRFVPGAFPANQLTAASHFYRLSYPFGYWNAVAAWGAMTVALGLSWGIHADRLAVRALALAAVPVAFLAVYLSYSRAGYAGTAVAVISVLCISRGRATAVLSTAFAAGGTVIAALAVYGAPRLANASGTQGRGSALAGLLFGCLLAGAGALVARAGGTDCISPPRRVAQGLTAVGAIAVLAVAGALGPRIVSRAWHSFTRPSLLTQSSDPTQRLLTLSGGRYSLWKAGIKAFRARPAVGTGAGTFEFVWDRRATDLEFARDAHNIWIQNLVELGIPGGVLIVGLALAALWACVSIRRRVRRRASAGMATAALAAFLVYLLHASVDWVWESTAVTVLAFVAVVVGGARLAGSSPPPLRWWRVPVVALALIAATVQVPGLLSTVDIRRSQAAERAGDGRAALSSANNAVAAEPWSASAYAQRGLVWDAAGDHAQAAVDLRRAIDHERGNFALWVVLARIETEEGHVRSAVRDYAQAHRLRPLSGVFPRAPSGA